MAQHLENNEICHGLYSSLEVANFKNAVEQSNVLTKSPKRKQPEQLYSDQGSNSNYSLRKRSKPNQAIDYEEKPYSKQENVLTCKYCKVSFKNIKIHLSKSKSCKQKHQDICSPVQETGSTKPGFNCKNCGEPITTLARHFRYNEDCKAEYTIEEIEAAPKKSKSESNKMFYEKNKNNLKDQMKEYHDK